MTFVVQVGSGSTADVRHCPVPIAALEGILIRLTARPVRQDITGAAGELVIAVFIAECTGTAAERRPTRITSLSKRSRYDIALRHGDLLHGGRTPNLQASTKPGQVQQHPLALSQHT